MKVLYAIQATGNGHVSRANEIIPLLQKKCDLDILVSGTQADVPINHFVTFRRNGFSFIFGKKGGIDFYNTFKQFQSKRFLTEIKNLPVENYDLVINDFEPISAWACKIKHIPCIAMSHQYAVLHHESPKPVKTDPFAWMVLRYYAPCKTGVGFHFKSFAENIFTPVIRKEIRQAVITDMGHYTVYLPAYDDKKLIHFLSNFKNVQWQIFSKHTKKSYLAGNCAIQPVNAGEFTKSFISCKGILCGAGFETPAEALYMKKNLLIIPMKHQYEQHCNSAAAAEMGVPVIKKLKKKYIHIVDRWLNEPTPLIVDYKDETSKIIDRVLALASLHDADKTITKLKDTGSQVFARAI
ncbi:MAG: glycosyl transferase [Ferruginibacter sp.]|nr:glycosyl transferase [Ferruginibacter sp.]